MSDILATISVILGIIVSCITIYQAFVKKNPTNSSPNESTYPQQYPLNSSQQVQSPQAYYPVQGQSRTFSLSGCIAVFMLTLLSLFLLIIIPFSISLIQAGRIGLPRTFILLLVAGILLLSLIVGIVFGFVRERQ